MFHLFNFAICEHLSVYFQKSRSFYNLIIVHSTNSGSLLLIKCMLGHFSCVWPFATLWTIACQTSLSVGFSMQEYWWGLPCPPQGISQPRDQTMSLASPALVVEFFTILLSKQPFHIQASLVATKTAFSKFVFL